MNLEGITLSVLTKELKDALEGGKIFRVFMPSKNSLLLLINKDNKTVNFLADFSGSSPLVYLPEALPERPNIPPVFCMLLRKHLEEGRITHIAQKGLDRIITFSIDMLGAGQQIITKHLILELTGKDSNVIFTDEHDVIQDAMRHIGKLQCSFRQILPGLAYTAPPEQTGLDFISQASGAIITAEESIPAMPILGRLISATVGIGKNTAEEILMRSSIAPDALKLTPQESSRCQKAIQDIQEEIKNCLHTKNYNVFGLINQRQVIKILVPYKPVNAKDGALKAFPSLLAASQYSAGLVPIQIPDKDLLTKTVSTALAKAKKKTILLAKDFAGAENADEQKIKADTLMANIYQLKKGATQCTLNNIYDNTPLPITLSPIMSPTENAQNYYKKYNKLKRAVKEIQAQQKENADLVTYLESLDASLSTATTKNEIAEIKQEIISLGLINPPKKKVLQMAKSAPMVVKLSEDTTLYVGKNNKQNDYVTFKLGKPGDLWFHVKNIPGSHVILKTTLPTPLEADILTAASYAAAMSKAKNSDKVAVDYTQRRYVKKPNGAKPGFVIYTDQETLYVKPLQWGRVLL